jgi:hypothetical protein
MEIKSKKIQINLSGQIGAVFATFLPDFAAFSVITGRGPTSIGRGPQDAELRISTADEPNTRGLSYS